MLNLKKTTAAMIDAMSDEELSALVDAIVEKRKAKEAAHKEDLIRATLKKAQEKDQPVYVVLKYDSCWQLGTVDKTVFTGFIRNLERGNVTIEFSLSRNISDIRAVEIVDPEKWQKRRG